MIIVLGALIEGCVCLKLWRKVRLTVWDQEEWVTREDI